MKERLQRTVEFAASQVVGVVDAVSPQEISVTLEHVAPQATALNASHLQRFPRINGWLLIPSEAGYLIGTVTWIGVDRAVSLRGEAGANVVDLPYGKRRLRLSPLGTLRWRASSDGGEPELLRGIVSYPSVGESVMLPTAEQLRAIARTGDRSARVRLGSSPLGGDVDVMVDPDRLFGRHIAVLGNTGSGKSCTVAGLIRWSIEAVKAETNSEPRARFIILDPNGEYTKCFDDVATVRVLRPELGERGGASPLTAPGWLWTSAEWAAISRASPQTQRPLLQQALRNLKNDLTGASTEAQLAATQLLGYAMMLRAWRSDVASLAKFPTTKSIITVLGSICHIVAEKSHHFDGIDLQPLGNVASGLYSSRQVQWPNGFSAEELESVIEELSAVAAQLPHDNFAGAFHEDMPKAFTVSDLPDHMTALSDVGPFAGTSSYTGSLILRIRTLLADARLRDVIAPDNVNDLAVWLAEVLGAPDGSNGQVTVLDLSLLSSEVVHTVVSVVARVVMEALQHARRIQGYAFPTVLVLEEAHTFVAAAGSGLDVPTTADLCRQTFETIAREGRKFGLGLVLSSQRPSELSQTVLSQCNTFLLHRLVNDRDQQLVGRLIPDALNDLLRELPAMPSGQAIMLGWATPVPVLVQMTELSPDQRPHSSDPEFWKAWTGENVVGFTWPDVVDRWLGGGNKYAGGEVEATAEPEEEIPF